MEQPFILCGLGRIGWRVLEYLQTAGLPVVVVDTRCDPRDPRLGKTILVKGDCRKKNVLLEAGVAQARGVLIMTNDDLVNISTALMVRHLNADVRVVMRLFTQNLIARLGHAVKNVYALSTATLTAPLFALSALTGHALGTLRLEGVKDGLRQVAEWMITANSPAKGQTIAAAAQSCEVLVLAHCPNHGKVRFLHDIDPETRLAAGDHLIVCGEPRVIVQLVEEDAALSNVRWAGWVQRMGRVFWRTLAEVDVAVKVCGAVLAAVILISTIVLDLTLANHRHELAHAFFRTISLMATGADMKEDELPQDWQKIFASVLRISGAALMAAFTAIVTNYLLRARLGGALEVRRIPDGGHVVVCGLGNIGFRVVEELVKSEERVVVIEQARDSRFVATARRLGVPVLIGDATIAPVLRQANVVNARAVIAATSDDLINLEVALMVRELDPSKRVVLHLSDPNLAQTLREAANVRLALSIPTLAAPTFVAALFGDRVQNVFMVDGRLLAAFEVVVPSIDPCLAGQSVRAVSVDYGLVPVAVIDAQGILHPRPSEVRLECGSRFVAISMLTDLERLLRRQPAPKNFAVDVGAVPESKRAFLASLLANKQAGSAAAAENLLDHPPLCLASDLTRGQAEDLVALLQREDIPVTLRQLVQPPSY
ncbi:MAG TPA: NAD-binding protein [Gemmataceae bacterium]|nr:NAD-binding protein [Gemmataceae bacterium]